jgi:hypothetical protein
MFLLIPNIFSKLLLLKTINTKAKNNKNATRDVRLLILFLLPFLYLTPSNTVTKMQNKIDNARVVANSLLISAKLDTSPKFETRDKSFNNKTSPLTSYFNLDIIDGNKYKIDVIKKLIDGFFEIV